MKSKLFQTKRLEDLTREATATTHGLKRVLGPWDLIFLGIGAIVGAGIFVITGRLVREYSLSAPTVSIGWSGYMVSFLKDLGLTFPARLSAAPFAFDSQHQTWTATGALFNLPAFIIVALITILLVIGIKESATVNVVIVFLKITAILIFIGAGLFFIKPGLWKPFVPANQGGFGFFGLSGILRGAGVIFFAYLGFDAVSTVAQEAKNPQKDVPRGILGSLFICTIIYIAFSLVLTGVVHYSNLNVAAPVAVAIDAMRLFWLSPLIKIAAIVGLISGMIVPLMDPSRIFFSMSTDGLIPKAASKVHPRFGTPHLTTIVTGLAVGVVASLLPIGIVGELASIGTLLAFIIVCAGVLVLRYTHPELPTPFRTPGVPFIPVLGILSCFYLMAGLPKAPCV